VRLREINGHDERRLAEIRNTAPVFLQSAELLARTAEFEGLAEELYHEAVSRLSVGDRVLLMLHLREQVLGDALHCTLDCPKCSEKMSLDMSVTALLEQRAVATVSAFVETDGLFMKVRPATHLDQELLLSNSPGGIQTFAESCIVSCEPPLPSGGAKEAVVIAIDKKLKEMDPLADIVLELKCPGCGHGFETVFDPEAFLLNELEMQSRQLDWEVHWLAFHYHWSEESILSLTSKKRRRYVEFINDNLRETP
jgi:hypothetical protein